MSDLVLYSYFRSSASYRVRIALNWKGLPFEYRAVHLLNNGGEQNTAQYKALNPTGEVPTLIHKGRTLAQSMAILHYLDAVFPEKPIFPQDAFQKAKVIQFSEGINCIQPLQNLRTQQFLEKTYGFNQAQKEQWVQEWAYRNLEASEKILTETSGSYCFGDSVTAADIFLIPQLFAVQRFNVDHLKYPTITRINENCQKLEAFRKAHPLQQPDTPATFLSSVLEEEAPFVDDGNEEKH